MAMEESDAEVITMRGRVSESLPGHLWTWSEETEWNGQELTAQDQRKEEPRTRAQTNAIVVNAQWLLQSDCRGLLNKEGIAICSPPPN